MVFGLTFALLSCREIVGSLSLGFLTHGWQALIFIIARRALTVLIMLFLDILKFSALFVFRVLP
jgi:hypothetical protein